MERNDCFKSKITKKNKPDSIIDRKTGNNSNEYNYDGFNTFLSNVGNQEIQRLFNGEMITHRMLQAKMDISQPGDFYEQQADQVANQIISNNGNTTNTAAKIDIIQAKGSNGDSVPENSEAQINNLNGKGSSLSSSVRSFFEPHFGVDLGNVRIHDSNSSNKLASSLNARAFTHGSDIVFNKGEFQPDTREGRKLLAHELTHVVQQSKGIVHRDQSTDSISIQRNSVRSDLEINFKAFIEVWRAAFGKAFLHLQLQKLFRSFEVCLNRIMWDLLEH